MKLSVPILDAALAVWVIAWAVAAVFVYAQVRQLEDVGQTVVTTGQGLAETSRALQSLSGGLRDTGRALDALNALPFIDRIDNRLDETAADVDRVTVRVRQAAREARTSGAQARASARPLAIVLAMAVGVAPTVPLALVYLLLRPLVAERLRARV